MKFFGAEYQFRVQGKILSWITWSKLYAYYTASYMNNRGSNPIGDDELHLQSNHRAIFVQSVEVSRGIQLNSNRPKYR